MQLNKHLKYPFDCINSEYAIIARQYLTVEHVTARSSCNVLVSPAKY